MSISIPLNQGFSGLAQLKLGSQLTLRGWALCCELWDILASGYLLALADQMAVTPLNTEMPLRHLKMSPDVAKCPVGVTLPPAENCRSSGQRPGVSQKQQQTKNVQCTGQPPRQRITGPQTSIGPRSRGPALFSPALLLKSLLIFAS